MEIKQAVEKDLISIEEISSILTISRDSKEKSGFVEYVTPSQEELKLRINDFFYVAIEKDKIVGFISAYSKKILKKSIFSKDQIIQHLLKNYHNFLYWEQIAVIKEYQNKGIGKELSKILLQEANKANYKEIYGAIIHKPFRNRLSIKLLQSFGFKEIEEINIYNGLVFGVYKKEL